MLRALVLLAASLAALAVSSATRALPSIEDARAAFIARVRPQVIACVRGLALTRGGPPRRYLAGCRDPARPQVRACVFRTLRDAGHPLLVGRPLPGPDAICPLGFEGCMSRCTFVGGFGPAPASKGCGRICSFRCAQARVEAGMPKEPDTRMATRDPRATPLPPGVVTGDWPTGY
jgi:hypothetical protein